jgi:hypothetical protein
MRMKKWQGVMLVMSSVLTIIAILVTLIRISISVIMT